MTVPRTDRFLDLPRRSTRPRRRGITHVIDNGIPLAEIEARLVSVGAYVDVWKFGFGTPYLDRQVSQKTAALRRNSVKACPGGTLLEVAWAQGRTDAFFGWAASKGFDCVEVSSGATNMPATDKHRLVEQAARKGFEVFAEVGRKNPSEPGAAEEWTEEARADAEAGADWLVAEGRESGNVGLYRNDGSLRVSIVEALEAVAGSVPVVYEAPRRAQQAWFIARLGPNVNLGNISPTEVLAVEALRLGLRSDTIHASQRHPKQ